MKYLVLVLCFFGLQLSAQTVIRKYQTVTFRSLQNGKEQEAKIHSKCLITLKQKPVDSDFYPEALNESGTLYYMRLSKQVDSTLVFNDSIFIAYSDIEHLMFNRPGNDHYFIFGTLAFMSTVLARLIEPNTPYIVFCGIGTTFLYYKAIKKSSLQCKDWSLNFQYSPELLYPNKNLDPEKKWPGLFERYKM